MIAATELRLVLVTPEKTLLDQSAKSMQFPLFDGQVGVLPGRAPLVGRLGAGELKFQTGSGDPQRFFIDGGFVQIKGSVVTLLTNRAVPEEKIDLVAAESELQTAQALVPHDEAGFAQKDQAINRAKKMIAIKRRIY